MSGTSFPQLVRWQGVHRIRSGFAVFLLNWRANNQKKMTQPFGLALRSSHAIFFALLLSSACKDSGPADKRIKQMDSVETTVLARAVEKSVTPTLAEGLTMKLWAGDSLVADPVSLDIDDQGRLYYTRTNRQKNSEFDIRGHQDWVRSVSFSRGRYP